MKWIQKLLPKLKFMQIVIHWPILFSITSKQKLIPLMSENNKTFFNKTKKKGFLSNKQKGFLSKIHNCNYQSTNSRFCFTPSSLFLPQQQEEDAFRSTSMSNNQFMLCYPKNVFLRIYSSHFSTITRNRIPRKTFKLHKTVIIIYSNSN